jgi:ribonuclease P protein component
MSFHFPKSARLLKSKEFSFIQRSGKKIYAPEFCLQVFQGQVKRSARLGLTVSRKYGASVERNLFKRRMREIFRLTRHQLTSGSIIHVKPQGKAQSKQQVSSFLHLRTSWEKVLTEHHFFHKKEEEI